MIICLKTAFLSLNILRWKKDKIRTAYVALCQTFFLVQYSLLSDALDSSGPSLLLTAVHDLIIHEDGHVLLMIKLQNPEIFNFEDAF